MGKITVKHFLNKELNSTQKGSQLAYPIYVQVIVLKKNLKFKSNNNLFYYLSEEDMKHPQVLSILEDEKKVVESIVSDLLNKGKEDLITSKNINMYSENLDDMIERKFSELLKIESEEESKFVPNIILSASYSEINEIIFFYGNNSPIADISSNVRNCMQAIEQIKDDVRKEIFYVYDLFGGSKYEQIISKLNLYTLHDLKHTNELLHSLQNLAIEL